jgi:hypothetical protein
LAMQQGIGHCDLIVRKHGPFFALEVNYLRVKELFEDGL